MDEELKAKIVAAAEAVAKQESERLAANYVAAVTRNVEHYLNEDGSLALLPDKEDFHGWAFEWGGEDNLETTNE